MKKKYIFILSILVLIFSISVISGGFFDGFFSDDNEGNNTQFIDRGIEGNNSSNWYYLKNLKVSVTDKGTILINNGEGNGFYNANKPSTSMDSTDDVIEWYAPYTIEFDVISDNGTSIQIFDKNNSSSRTFEQLCATSNAHVKLINDGSTIKYFANGVNDSIFTSNISINQSGIRFVIPEGTSVTYKNFVIY